MKLDNVGTGGQVSPGSTFPIVLGQPLLHTQQGLIHFWC